MMVVTHVAIGLAVTLPLTLLAPWAAGPVAAGALVGGAVPDADLLVGTHRRTLHFPALGPLAATPALALAVVTPTPATVGLAAALVAAGVHAATDVLGAGEELRPWERTNTNAVYCHLCRRWLRARYVIRYDGSPEDLLLAVAAAIPALIVHDGPVRWLLAGLLVLATAYTALRKRLVPYFSRIV